MQIGQIVIPFKLLFLCVIVLYDIIWGLDVIMF